MARIDRFARFESRAHTHESDSPYFWRASDLWDGRIGWGEQVSRQFEMRAEKDWKADFAAITDTLGTDLEQASDLFSTKLRDSIRADRASSSKLYSALWSNLKKVESGRKYGLQPIRVAKLEVTTYYADDYYYVTVEAHLSALHNYDAINFLHFNLGSVFKYRCAFVADGREGLRRLAARLRDWLVEQTRMGDKQLTDFDGKRVAARRR